MNSLKKLIKENIEKLNNLDKLFHNFTYKYTDIESKEENDQLVNDYDMLMDKLMNTQWTIEELKKYIAVKENVIKDLSNNPKISDDYVKGLQSALNDLNKILNQY